MSKREMERVTVREEGDGERAGDRGERWSVRESDGERREMEGESERERG